MERDITNYQHFNYIYIYHRVYNVCTEKGKDGLNVTHVQMFIIVHSNLLRYKLYTKYIIVGCVSCLFYVFRIKGERYKRINLLFMIICTTTGTQLVQVHGLA